MELSNIPNTGFFNRIASLINENFDKIRQRFLEVGDASASANAAAVSAAQAAQSLATIQNEIASLDPSQSTEAAITALDAKIAVNKANIETLDDRVDSIGGVKTTNVYTLPASWRAETFGIEDGDKVKITFNNASVQTVGGLYLYINYASSPAVTKYVRLGSSAVIDIGEGYQRIQFWAVASSSSSTQIACDVSLTVQIYGEMTVLEEEIETEAEQIENLQDRIESSSTDYSLTFTSSAISNPINVSAGDIIEITITSFVSETANCIFLQINRTGGASKYYQIRPNEKARFTLPDDYNGMYMQARVYGQTTSTGYPAQVGMTVDKIGLTTRVGDIERYDIGVINSNVNGAEKEYTVTVVSSGSQVSIGLEEKQVVELNVTNISNPQATFVYYWITYGTSGYMGGRIDVNAPKLLRIPTGFTNIRLWARNDYSGSEGFDSDITLTVRYVGLLDRVSDLESSITTLPLSSFVTSEMLADKRIQFPVSSAQYTRYNVSTQVQLAQAVTAYNGGADVMVVLSSDILLDDAISLTGSGDFRLEGCGYTLMRVGTTYSNGDSFSSIPNPRTIFVTNTKEILRLTESKRFNATGRVTKGDGTAISDGKLAGTYRVPVPTEVGMIGLDTDNTFMNITAGFVSYTVKVTEVGNGYVMFYKDATTYTVDYDYSNYNKLPNLFFINVKGVAGGVTIKDGKISFPMRYQSVRIPSGSIINAQSAGMVELCGTEFVGGHFSSDYPMLKGVDSVITMDACTVRGGGMVSVRVSASSGSLPTVYAAQLHIRGCEFRDIAGYGAMGDQNTIVTCTDSRFIDMGIARTNSSCVYAVGKFYIADNTFIDYGYNAVQVGWNGNYIGNHTGAVERNYIKYSPEYMAKASEHNLMDGGAIYSGAHSDGIYIRYNRIVNYAGRYINRGIYIDDGGSQSYIIGNVIENVPNYYAICARLANGRGSQYEYNVDKVVIYNIFEGAIRVQGAESANNGCLIGYNIRVGGFGIGGDAVKNIESQEDILELKGLSLVDGTVHTPLDLSKWGII